MVIEINSVRAGVVDAIQVSVVDQVGHVSSCLSEHRGTANDADDGVRQTGDDDGQDRSFRNGCVWILLTQI